MMITRNMYGEMLARMGRQISRLLDEVKKAVDADDGATAQNWAKRTLTLEVFN